MSNDIDWIAEVEKLKARIRYIKSKRAMNEASFNLLAKCNPCPYCDQDRRVENATLFCCSHYWERLKPMLKQSEDGSFDIPGVTVVIEPGTKVEQSEAGN